MLFLLFALLAVPFTAGLNFASAPVRIAYSSISGAMKILAEVYRNYGQKHLHKSINVDLEGVTGLLKGLGSEAGNANPANFVDASLLQDLDREGFFQGKNSLKNPL